MVTDDRIERSSTDSTATTLTTLMETYDGYKLKFTVYDIQQAILVAGDINAVCLGSNEKQGVICGGLTYDATTSVQTWARFLSYDAFTSTSYCGAAAGVSVDLSLLGYDQSSDWWYEPVTGYVDTATQPTGAVNTDFAVFRYQIKEGDNTTTITDEDENGDEVELEVINNVRFDPSIEDIKAWIYIYNDANSPKGQCYGNQAITLASA